MRAKIETITPAIAAAMLENNPKNRSVSLAAISRFAADMRAGRWTCNGQTISFSPDGQLLDGQHRLRGIIQADVSIDMLVVRGVSPETFVTIDSGRIRSTADMLTIEGHVSCANLGAAVRAAYGFIAGVSVRYQPTKGMVSDFVKAHPHMAEVSRAIAGAGFKLPTSALTAVMFLATDGQHNHLEIMGSFLDGLKRGEGLFRGDARLTLREWVSAQRVRGRGVITADAMFAATARAWNAYASGRTLTVLKALDAPTQANLQIVGFDRIRYPDVPDLVAKKVEAGRQLAKTRAETAAAAERQDAAPLRKTIGDQIMETIQEGREIVELNQARARRRTAGSSRLAVA